MNTYNILQKAGMCVMNINIRHYLLLFYIFSCFFFALFYIIILFSDFCVRCRRSGNKNIFFLLYF